MIKIRNSCFETNSSSTHALIVKNEDFLNRDIDNDVNKLSAFEIEGDIEMLSGEISDRLENNISYGIYEGKLTNIVDKLRYIYTVLIQDNLYYEIDGKVYIDDASDAYKVFEMLKTLFPKVKFIPPKRAFNYIFEDCEYLVEDILKSEYLTTVRGLVAFFLKGRVEYCDRDYESDRSDKLHKEAKDNNLCSVCISG